MTSKEINDNLKSIVKRIIIEKIFVESCKVKDINKSLKVSALVK
jgi:hypothetical protein